MAIKRAAGNSAAGSDKNTFPDDQKHPIYKVHQWKERLERDPTLTKVQIAQQEGLSKSRMTQMFRLMNLPGEVQEYLSNLRDSRLIRSFSIRQLSEIAKMLPHERSEAFERLREGCGTFV